MQNGHVDPINIRTKTETEQLWYRTEVTAKVEWN